MGDLDEDFLDVLRVLAITVIIDQHVRSPELEEFEKQAKGLSELFDHSSIQNFDSIKWYQDNAGIIHQELEGRSRNTVILKAITAVKDETVRESLYDAMLAVSISDDEYHRKESDFVRSAAAIWGYVRPPFKVSKT